MDNREPNTQVDASKQKPLRLSIEPTYDSRETGPRYHIETFVADKFINIKPLPDPFVRHTVRVSVLDAISVYLAARQRESANKRQWAPRYRRGRDGIGCQLYPGTAARVVRNGMRAWKERWRKSVKPNSVPKGN